MLNAFGERASLSATTARNTNPAFPALTARSAPIVSLVRNAGSLFPLAKCQAGVYGTASTGQYSRSVHHLSAFLQDRPELLPVHGLGDMAAGMASNQFIPLLPGSGLAAAQAAPRRAARSYARPGRPADRLHRRARGRRRCVTPGPFGTRFSMIPNGPAIAHGCCRAAAAGCRGARVSRSEHRGGDVAQGGR
jgi:hypothetical protein